MAIAVNAELTYAVVESASGEPFKYLVVAKDLAQKLGETFGSGLQVVAEIKGEALAGTTYRQRRNLRPSQSYRDRRRLHHH